MKRETKERTILDAFAEDFVAVVEKYAKYVIVSGFVAIAHGRIRGTEDVGGKPVLFACLCIHI